jgi:cytochrome bd-type quinol oxidase subunit 2
LVVGEWRCFFIAYVTLVVGFMITIGHDVGVGILGVLGRKLNTDHIVVHVVGIRHDGLVEAILED